MMSAVHADARGRYAPSPSGPQHLGNARTALLAWLQIRATGGRFVLRVEDLDRARCKPAFEALVIEDLRWLGLDWDEGPDVGGSCGPYRQSERDAIYEAALGRLSTFACSCTRRELRETASAPHGVEPVYPGTCVDGPRDPARPLAVRWHVPRGRVAIEDEILGTIEQDVETEIGDFVLRRTDGGWAYQLAVVVDDAAMGITHVLRGQDLVASTPRQVLLQRALGLPTPQYAHVPLLLGPDGEKLSKRHGAPDMKTLREGGADAGHVVAVLARSAGLVGAHVHHVMPRELVGDFDLGLLDGATNVLDPAALR